MKKKTGRVLLCLLLAAVLTGCSGGESTRSPLAFDAAAAAAVPEDGEVVAENGDYRLLWDASNSSVRLQDTATGAVWGTSPKRSEDEQFDDLGMPIKRSPQVESALFVEYIDGETRSLDTVISYTGAVNNGRIRCTRLENGLRVEYYFDSNAFMIPVEYTLRESGVLATIRPEEIQEEDDQIIRISLAPFWCNTANSSEDGYLFVPSGSGALIYAKELSRQGSLFSEDVYGRDPAAETWNSPTTTKEIKLPVYGAVDAAAGTCAIIESGAEHAVIQARIGASALKYSAVYATFQLRGSTDNIASLFASTKVQNVVYADAMIGDILSIGFYPLQGDEAGYAGMSRLYRHYLETNAGLPETCEDSALHVEFLGGAMVPKSFLGLPYESLYAATTIAQATDMIEQLRELADVPMTVSLKGFGTTGLDPGKPAGGYTINRSLGTLEDLRSLLAFCTDSGVQTYMDFELVHFSSGGSGFSTFFDAAYSASRKIAYQYKFDIAVRGRLEAGRYLLLSRSQVDNSVTRLLEKTEGWGLVGIGIGSLANTAYSDYGDTESSLYYAKGNMGTDVREALLKLKAAGRSVLASDANDYAAVHASQLLNVPGSSSSNLLFDEDVPFYSMVFKGHVPLAGESVNLAEDPQRTILQAVESGSGLHYTVIHQYESVLLDAAYPVFYGSVFSDISEQIAEQTQALREYYERTANAEILNHRILKNGLRMTTFSNGVTVYVNYGDQALTSPAGEVNPLGFRMEGKAP